jgi:hypothetical protein
MKNFLIFLASTATLLIGCTRNENDLVATQRELPCISEEMLTFSSMEDFTDFMGYLHGYEPEDLDNVAQLSGFISHRLFFDSLEYKPEDAICEIDENDEIEDSYLASVLNIEKELKIGESYYQVNNDFTFGYKDCDGKTKISSFKDEIRNGSVIISNGDSMTYDSDLWVYKVDDSESSNIGFSESYVRTNEFQSNRRVKGKMWRTHWGVYTSMGTKTKMQKKSCGVWVKTKADVITVSWDVHYLWFTGVTDFIQCNFQGNQNLLGETGTKTRNNEKKSEKIFDWAAGIGTTIPGSTVPTFVTDIFPGLPGTVYIPTPVQGPPLSFIRHGPNNCFSNHSVQYSGNHSTPRVEWNPCN